MAIMVDKNRIGGSHSGSRSYPLRDLSYGNNLGDGNNKSMVTSGIDAAGDAPDMDINEAAKYGPNGRDGRRKSSRPRSSNGPSIPSHGTGYYISEKEENMTTMAIVWRAAAKVIR